jgi:hypothetical protein
MCLQWCQQLTQKIWDWSEQKVEVITTTMTGRRSPYTTRGHGDWLIAVLFPFNWWKWTVETFQKMKLWCT